VACVNPVWKRRITLGNAAQTMADNKIDAILKI
jgi:hypothetical protein